MSANSFNRTSSAETFLATDQQPAPRLGGATGKGWMPGKSGNPNGRPKAPVDIAALARVHGPRCIAVAAELLDDPDSRVRLAALTALLDRGFGRPKMTVESADGTNPAALHLLAAQLVSARLITELEQHGHQPHVINGEAEPTPQDLLNAPPPME